MATPIPDGDLDRIRNALYGGRKIEAIKLYRESSGAGLKEAKDFADGLEDELRRTEPQNFAAPPAKWGCGLTLLLLLFGGAYVVTVWA